MNEEAGDPTLPPYRQDDAAGRGDGLELPSDRRLALARWILGYRRMRERFFSGELFADPAWDILLDLYVARRLGQAVSVSSLCIASGVPQTTALRWIKLLTERGLLMREDDARDRRRINIGLTPETFDRIETFLDLGPDMVEPS